MASEEVFMAATGIEVVEDIEALEAIEASLADSMEVGIWASKAIETRMDLKGVGTEGMEKEVSAVEVAESREKEASTIAEGVVRRVKVAFTIMEVARKVKGASTTIMVD